MINEKEKFIFLHIPKTGGTSIEDFVIPKKWETTNNLRHYNIRRMGLTKKECDEYTIFSVIRNPFDRIVSTYKHFLVSEYGGAESNYPFYEYVRNIDRYFEGELKVNTDTVENSHMLYRATDAKGRVVLDSQHVETTSWWTRTLDGKTADCKFLRFEQLNNDWNDFKHKIDIRSPDTLEKLNMSVKTRSYVNYYQLLETRDIIQYHYKTDIEKFGYQFLWMQKPCIMTVSRSYRDETIERPKPALPSPHQKEPRGVIVDDIRLGPIHTDYIMTRTSERRSGMIARAWKFLTSIFKGRNK